MRFDVSDVRSENTVEIDSRYVVAVLEQAGQTLLALPGSGFSPQLQQAGMDVVRNFMDAYGWTEIQIKPPRPSPAAIDTMDRVMTWFGRIPQDRYVLRRIVGARMLVNPVTERHLFTWRRIGKVLGCDYRAVQQWHAEAIDLIVVSLRRENIFTNPCSN